MNWTTLADPPYWDGLVGVYHQGSWWVEQDLDFQALAAAKSYAEGGPILQIENAVAFLFAIGQKTIGQNATFISLHFLSILAASIALTLLLRLLNEHLPQSTAWLWVLSAGATPLFSAQVATIYLEIPLALAAISVIIASQNEHYKLAATICVGSWAIKPTSTLIALALASWALFRVVFERRGELPKMSLHNRFITVVPALILLPLFFGTRFNFEARGGLTLAQRIFYWLIQTVSCSPYELILVTLTIFMAAGVLIYRPSRQEFLRDPRRLSLIVVLASLTWGYWLSHAIHELPLTRYLAVIILPMTALFAISLSLIAHASLQRIVALLCLCIGVGNQWGHLLPAHPTSLGRSGDRLERSREYLEDLAQNRELCRFIEENYFDSEIIAQPPFVHMLTQPALGYVTRPLPNVLAVTYPCHGTPARFLPAPQVAERYANGALVVYAPNGYALNPYPSLAPAGPIEVLLRQEIADSPLLLYRRAR